jgi:hypothetical protein
LQVLPSHSIADQAQDFARHAKAPNTLKAYRNDWDDFLGWCGLHRLEPLPATRQTIALYLTDLSRTHRVSTLYRSLSGISQAHQAAGHASPTRDPQVRLVFQGIRRALGSAPDQKHAAITAEVRAMVETLDLSRLSGSPTLGWGGQWRRVTRCAHAHAAPRLTSPATARISTVGSSMPALVVADTLRLSR